MKKLIQIMTLGILTVFGATAWAAQHDASAEKPMAEQMQKMHSHMQEMQAQMKEIKATKDPEKRKDLMRQHRQSMHDGMMMMGKMDQSQGEGMAHSTMQQKRTSMDCNADDEQCQQMQSMQHRQDAMQERMQMMQMMMRQMMEHQSAQAEQ